MYQLIDGNGTPYCSSTKGRLGGHKGNKIYGQLDCPVALRYIAKGQYVKNRVFFADEKTAQNAGYRPCAVCMPQAYKDWKKLNAQLPLRQTNKKGKQYPPNLDIC